tara:strand:- start:3847 stop:4149 length:303 start_codon:yes stop_codon:yes gene_type:complete
MKQFLNYSKWFLILMALFFVLSVNTSCARMNKEIVYGWNEEAYGTEYADSVYAITKPLPKDKLITTEHPLLEVDRTIPSEENDEDSIPSNSSEGSNSDDN